MLPGPRSDGDESDEDLFLQRVPDKVPVFEVQQLISLTSLVVMVTLPIDDVICERHFTDCM